MQSPARNRVTPLGDIVAIPLRGAWLGNRGILHRGTEVVRFHRSPLWIICALQHKDWRLPQWHPHHFTVLFFHDEAVAFAAGHRPCALCRRDAYNRYRSAAFPGTGEAPPRAWQLDRRLHGERLYRGTHRRRLHDLPWAQLPTGAFVLADDGPALIDDDAIIPWTAAGYGPARSRPRTGRVAAITPPTTLRALHNGYHVQVGAASRAAGRIETPAEKWPSG